MTLFRPCVSLPGLFLTKTLQSAGELDAEDEAEARLGFVPRTIERGPMSAENTTMLAERTDELLNRGRSQGFISTEDVADLLQEGELSATEVEEFYATLEEEAISIVEGEGAALPETATGSISA